MNDFSNVKVILNPIKSLCCGMTLKGSQINSKNLCEFLPRYLDFSEGVWNIKINTVIIQCAFPLATDSFQAVMDIRTNLISTYVPKTVESGLQSKEEICPTLQAFAQNSNFVQCDLSLFTFLVNFKSSNKINFLENKTLNWFTVEAKPYNCFYVSFCNRTPLPEQIESAEFKIDVEFLFQRMK